MANENLLTILSHIYWRHSSKLIGGSRRKTRCLFPVAQQTFKYPALVTGYDPVRLFILLQSNGNSADEADL